MSLCCAIDIIIPVYKNALLTKRCIDSVLENIHEIKQFSPRLLVINDSPDDQAVNSMLEDLAVSESNVLIYTNTVNCGFVKSVNRGLKESVQEGRDVILINSDTETFEGTLANLVNAAYSDSQIGFVSPRSNNASICTFPHSFSPTLLTPKESYKRWKEVSVTLPDVHFTPTAIGFYLFIKHKILANFGLLQEDFGLGYEEENDLIMRANKAGYRAALANRSFAYHAGSASFKLLDFDLHIHRNDNLQKLCAIYPEFLPLVRRYESSAHFRAEFLMSGLAGYSSDPIKVVFDLSELGCHHNGTNELALRVVKSFSERQSHNFELSALCSDQAFKFHKMNDFGNITRIDLTNPSRHAIAIRLGQPFDQHHINVLENLAPINIYGMLDTIAEDCGHLSITHNLKDLWQHVARHANGLFYISQFSEKTFCSRYPEVQTTPKYTRLLPTRLSSYAATQNKLTAQHVLILGNHFPHKASDSTATILSQLFPTVQFVVLGGDTFEKGNLRGYRSGTLEAEIVSTLFSRASVVVLPSHVEGFGFGLMHALAAHKPIVARNIVATLEILSTYKKVEGVYLYNNDAEIKTALLSAMKQGNSTVDDTSAIGWDEWTDGLAVFFKQLLVEKDLFPRLSNRIYASDLLRRKAQSEVAIVTIDSSTSSDNLKNTVSLSTLLQHEDDQFIEFSYQTILKRPSDPQGFNNYLSQLRGGIPKIKILANLQNSAEGKEAGVEVEGLHKAIQQYKRSQLPIIGYLFRSLH